MELHQQLSQFYLTQLPDNVFDGSLLKSKCPFCQSRGRKEAGILLVNLDPDNYFCGYFRCLSRCLPGGFAPRFAKLRGIDPSLVPGYDPDREPYVQDVDFPLQNINNDILKYQGSLTAEIISFFSGFGINRPTLQEMKIGFNGRYLVYPYFQDNGRCYAAHCITPEKKQDHFWHGSQEFAQGQFSIFNLEDINFCEDGSLFIVEGEDNLLCLKELGFPGIAVPKANDLAHLDPARFEFIKNIFLVVENSPESDAASRAFASSLGFKVRLIRWPVTAKRKFNLVELAKESGAYFSQAVLALIDRSKAFSPFLAPKREYHFFLKNLANKQGASYQELQSGLTNFDTALNGIHGINIIGGPPKAGKSCFAIQLATEMALNKVPVIYYDFENGRQKIYQRTLARLSRIEVSQFSASLNDEQKTRLATAHAQLSTMMQHFRVVNDRKLNPQIMRRHIDFLRHETQRDHIVVVIDSVHKLPFKDFSERRTGIDAWLREMESIRDELQVSFLVISELDRQENGRYDGVPHMGVFKGSGDIEYTADNAMVLLPDWDPMSTKGEKEEKTNSLWLVASRENSPGLISRLRLDFPYWGFSEINQEDKQHD